MSCGRCAPIVVLLVVVGMFPACPGPEVQPPAERAALSLSSPSSTTQARPPVSGPAFMEFDKLAEGLPEPSRPMLPTLVTPDLPGKPLFYPESEPNNAIDQATEITLPCTVSGHFHPLPDSPDGDHDWFAFSVERDHPALLELDVSGVKGVNLGLELYHETLKERPLLLAVDNAPVGKGETVPNFRLMNGRYWLHLLQTGKKPGWNVLQPYLASLTIGDAPSGETEPNDSERYALPLVLPARIDGVVNKSEDSDWFSVDLLKLSSFSKLSVSLLPPMGATLRLGLFTQARQEVLSVTALEGRRVTIPNIAVVEDATTYFIEVLSLPDSPAGGSYTLEAAAEPLPERVELEPNDHPDAALRLLWEVPLTGWLAVEGDADWFELRPLPELEAGTGSDRGPVAMQLTLSSVPGADLVLEVFDVSEETLLARLDAGGKGEGEEAPNLAMPTGTVYIKVSASKGYNSGSPYALEARLAAVVGMEVEPNNSIETATVLAPGSEPVGGYIVPSADRDCFRFLPVPPVLRVVPPQEGVLMVSGYASDGTLVFQEKAHGDRSVAPPVPQTSALCMEAASGSPLPRGAYSLSFQPE